MAGDASDQAEERRNIYIAQKYIISSSIQKTNDDVCSLGCCLGKEMKNRKTTTKKKRKKKKKIEEEEEKEGGGE